MKSFNTKYLKIASIMILSAIFHLLLVNTTFAAIRYPIKELGSCRDGRECFLYCQIPQNSPACWSYGKYVINKNVLGSSAVSLKYPISELGNCKNAKECFEFCQKKENQIACTNYAISKHLVTQGSNLPKAIAVAAKKELGCNSFETCRNICDRASNMQLCQAFSDKYNFPPKAVSQTASPITSQVLANARKSLGCSTKAACLTFCSRKENYDKCWQFAKNNNLASKDLVQREKDYQDKLQKLLSAAKQELNCNSFDSCAQLCALPENISACLAIKARVEQAITSIASQYSQEVNTSSTPTPALPAGCATEKECQKYCEAHKEECPYFPQGQNQPFVFPTAITPTLQPTNQPASAPNAKSNGKTTPTPTATSAYKNAPLESVIPTAEY